MLAATILRTAREASGLTQRALAQRAKDHQPTISALERGSHDPGLEHLQRLLVATGHRLVLVPTRARPVNEAAAAVETALRQSSIATALREVFQLSDDLVREHGDVRAALSAAPPVRVGDPRFDALIAAVTEHHLRAEDLPLPEWLTTPDRRLADPWFVDDLPSERERIKAETPPAFARRGVYLSASELVSV